MKKLLTILLGFFAIISFAGCGKDQTPDNVIHGERQSTDFKWEVVEPGKDPVQVFPKEVMISPTWGQSNKYASERGDFSTWQWIGLILLVVLVVVVYARATERININPIAMGALMLLLSAGSLTSFKWQSSSIKWNNDKWVKKEVYDKAIKESGSTKPIWDSLRRECKIAYGPYECYEKK